MNDNDLSIPLHYSKLWSLPNTRTLLLITLIMSVIYIIIFTSYTDNVKLIISNVIIMSATILLLLFIKIDAYITARRGLAIYFMIILASLIHLILERLGSIFGIIATIISVTILAYTFNALPIITKDFKRGLIGVSFLLPLSSSMLYFNDMAIKELKNSLINLMLPSIITITGLLYILHIEITGKKHYGLGPVSLFRAFLRLWSNKDPTKLESELSKISTTTEYTARLLVFYNDNKPVGALASIPIHPGPIMHMGSSNLPSELMKQLWNDSNIAIMPFHVPSNHESDLILSSDREKVISIIKTAISETQGITEKVYITRLIEIHENQIKVKAFVINNTPIITVTAAPLPMEDLPENIVSYVNQLASQLSFKEPIIIDTHNSLSNNRSEILPDDIVMKASIKAIEKALTELKKLEQKPGKIGFIKNAFPGKPHEGYGEGGIITIVLEPQNEKPFYLTLFDSNNMITGLREKILNETLKIGFDGEVCTTDTHSVVALTPGGKGYSMLGENGNNDEIIKIITSQLENIKLKEVTVKDLKITITNLKVLGKSLYKLDEMTKKYVIRGEMYPIIMFILSAFVTILFKLIPYFP